MTAPERIEQELVLSGGGHAHVGVARYFAMNPVPGVRITLICRDIHTPYSGMLPGYIAGHYSFDDAHIDLDRLCTFAGIRFIHDEVAALDPHARVLSFQSGRPDLSFDVLSLNTGAAPNLKTVPGAAEFAVPVKPVNAFLDRWERLVTRLEAKAARQSGPESANIPVVIVGGGAGGVELCLAIEHRFRTRGGGKDGIRNRLKFTLVSRSKTLLPTHPKKAQDIFTARFKERNIDLLCGTSVARVHADRLELSGNGGGVGNGPPGTLPYEALLWVTKAGPPDWLARTGLETTDRGFLSVRSTLQVQKFDRIFAAGDVGDVVEHPREKAGVFAVRQGPPLARNLARVLQGKAAKAFRPQKSWLSLISTGDRFAVATRGNRVLSGPVLWRWKDRIDRKFMDRFGNLTPRPMTAPRKPPENPMRCLGCGAKVGRGALEKALAVAGQRFPGVISGIGDDAARVVPPQNLITQNAPLFQTLDFLPAFGGDPRVFGTIATEHALSDLYAMGLKPTSVQLLLSLPPCAGHIMDSDLNAVMAGVCACLDRAGAGLIGGHTVEGAFGVGMVVNGHGRAQFFKANLKPGDALVLTKPIGSGCIMAGQMQLKAKGRHVAGAFETMMLSNAGAAQTAAAYGATAVTDVTGFGLAGHGFEMARASGVKIEIALDRVPALDAALELAAGGVRSSLFDANRKGFQTNETAQNQAMQDLMFDPQTGGGLLIGIPAATAQALVRELRGGGYTAAAVIGRVAGTHVPADGKTSAEETSGKKSGLASALVKFTNG